MVPHPSLKNSPPRSAAERRHVVLGRRVGRFIKLLARGRGFRLYGVLGVLGIEYTEHGMVPGRSPNCSWAKHSIRLGARVSGSDSLR
jgi:hypothetical protein